MIREPYETEEEILNRVLLKLKEEGYKITKTQLNYLYTVVVKYISEKAEDPNILGIRLPHLGTMYIPKSSVLKKIHYLKSRKNTKRLSKYKKKLKILESETTSKIYKIGRLKNNIRFVGTGSFMDNLNKQNNDFEN